MSTAITLAPSDASFTACARPWPRAAPVTKATLPLRAVMNGTISKPYSVWYSVVDRLVGMATLYGCVRVSVQGRAVAYRHSAVVKPWRASQSVTVSTACRNVSRWSGPA